VGGKKDQRALKKYTSFGTEKNKKKLRPLKNIIAVASSSFGGGCHITKRLSEIPGKPSGRRG